MNQHNEAMEDTLTKAAEHPIIMQGESIRAILSGEKTVTRRVVRHQPHDPRPHAALDQGPHYRDGTGLGFLKDGPGWYTTDQTAVDDCTHHPIPCPYGESGHVLWVREAFRLPDDDDSTSPSEYVDDWQYVGEEPLVRYEADGHFQGFAADMVRDGFHMSAKKYGDEKYWEDHYWGRLRPSIHMPRALCRLRLRIEGVRVERVQDISTSDCIAEGLTAEAVRRMYADRGIAMRAVSAENYDYRRAFQWLWDDINGSRDGGTYAWEQNPWVWRIRFLPTSNRFKANGRKF